MGEWYPWWLLHQHRRCTCTNDEDNGGLALSCDGDTSRLLVLPTEEFKCQLLWEIKAPLSLCGGKMPLIAARLVMAEWPITHTAQGSISHPPLGYPESARSSCLGHRSPHFADPFIIFFVCSTSKETILAIWHNKLEFFYWTKRTTAHQP